jgi:hypothetical protein
MKKTLHASIAKVRAVHARHQVKLRAGAWIALGAGFLTVVAISSQLPALSLSACVIGGVAALVVRVESSVLFKLAIGFIGAAAIVNSLEREAAAEQIAVCGFIMLAFGTAQVATEQIISRRKARKVQSTNPEQTVALR